MKPPKLAIAGCRDHERAARADQTFLTACLAAGWQALRLPWDEAGMKWEQFDACIIRSTWDWHSDPPRFQSWVRSVSEVTTLWNPRAVVEWTLDKRYLVDLAALGVDCVPTLLVAAADVANAPRLAAERGWKAWIIKPSLSAGANRTALIRSAADLERWRQSHQSSVATGTLVIQPYQRAIESLGEISLIYIDGGLTHAVRKLPAAGDFRVQGRFGGRVELAEATPAEKDLAQRCLAALPGEAIYGRIDMICGDDGISRIIECETVEPELFFDFNPAAADRLARALLDRHRLKKESR